MCAIAKSRIDPELKRQAEAVLEEIGLKPRAALELFYKQIIKRRAIPFPVQADSPEDDVLSPAVRRKAIDEILDEVCAKSRRESAPQNCLKSRADEKLRRQQLHSLSGLFPLPAPGAWAND
jgi:addiction module RelB/DinJ family antitoxin